MMNCGVQSSAVKITVACLNHKMHCFSRTALVSGH